ncbi:MAG: TIGR04053 family radical SAM/SPASM domain-containing protein [Bowdeniella nasicola]|nr:TIGR04053 family radical SAM/SPASM domain-containing protein [Bowdeniella nasicola]
MHPHRRVVRTIHHDVNEKPFLVIWEVTRACQLVCKHCRAEAQHRPDPRELGFDEGRALLDQLASYDHPRPMLVLTGGDCFERPDLVDLVRYGTEQGLHISISPSVTPLFTREKLTALRAAGGKAMSVSLDGARPATHDNFRGFPGTFERTVEATKMIREEGFRLQINTTLTRANIGEAPQMLANAIEMGAFMWYIFLLVPTGRGAQLEALSADEREDVLHWLHDVSDRIAIKTTEAPQYRRIALQRQRGQCPVSARGALYFQLRAATALLLGDRPVNPRVPRPPLAINSGSGFAFISHIGDVYPSGFLPIKVGNIREQPFATIYRESPVMRELRQPEGFGGNCGICEFKTICGGSRSTAYALSGDYRAADPSCAYHPAS